MGRVDMATSGTARNSLSAAMKIVEDLERSLVDVRIDLRDNRAETLEDIKTALKGIERREALVLLECLNPDVSKELIDPLLAVALSVADTLQVRNLLGRLPYKELQSVVPAAVWRFLDRRNEGDAYWRMAELFEHLGLEAALQHLCVRARDSIDPDIREVAEEFQSFGD